MVSPKIVAKIESEEPTLRLAVLIDADNAQAAVIEGLLAEIARFGEATVKRIYGDFTAPTSASWKKVLQRYAITVQPYLGTYNNCRVPIYESYDTYRKVPFPIHVNGKYVKKI